MVSFETPKREKQRMSQVRAESLPVVRDLIVSSLRLRSEES